MNHSLIKFRNLVYKLPGFRRLYASLSNYYSGHHSDLRQIPLDHILRGGESGIDASRYASLVGDLLLPSTPISQGPHLDLLNKFHKLKGDVLAPSLFQETAYFMNACKAIEISGRYFGARRREEIVEIAKAFLRQERPTGLSAENGHSNPDDPITVRAIEASDCFQIIDGNHRAARSIFQGHKDIAARIIGLPVRTPLQEVLLASTWQNGRFELYQPVDSPELAKYWHLVRKCTDRFDLMRSFLESKGCLPANGSSYLDLGSNYGWFVARMGELGFNAFGVERDIYSNKIGVLKYGISKEQIHETDIFSFLSSRSDRYDVVSLFSILHHFLLKNGACSAEELIYMVSSICRGFLFIDTGQNHEHWFSQSLPEWDDGRIVEFLKTNTNFRNVIKLGSDKDNRGPHKFNYGRSLFVCFR